VLALGIETMGAGFKHIIVQPHPSKRLNYAKASFESSYGLITSGWERKDGKVTFRIKIPANTSATIVLPVTDASKVAESKKAISGNSDFTNLKTADNKITFEAGSGEYIFETTE